MTQTLARIASHTARGLYAFILWKGGTTNRQELIDSGYTRHIVTEAIAELECAGLVIRLKGGMYRSVIDIDAAPTAQEAAIAASTKKAAIPAQEAAIAASSAKRVNVVNLTESNKLTIGTTSDFDKIIQDLNKEDFQRYYDLCLVVGETSPKFLRKHKTDCSR